MKRLLARLAPSFTRPFASRAASEAVTPVLASAGAGPWNTGHVAASVLLAAAGGFALGYSVSAPPRERRSGGVWDGQFVTASGGVLPMLASWGGGRFPQLQKRARGDHGSLSSTDEAALKALSAMLAAEPVSTDPPADLVLYRSTIADAAAKALPSVVNISHTIGLGPLELGHASGSGFIIDGDGLIVTNAHVTGDGALGQEKLRVVLQDGRTFVGRVIACDGASDLAVVKIDSSSPLPVVRLGRSAGLRAGEIILSLGSPLQLQGSVTSGIISAVERKGIDMGLAGRAEFIQTDAGINVGNSGGPCIDLEGSVIAVNQLKAAFAEGISFSIPIDFVRDILIELGQFGRVRRPHIGVKLLELNAEAAHVLRDKGVPIPPRVDQGVLVVEVLPGSPASTAGMRPGDVITFFDGGLVGSVKDLFTRLGHQIGRPLSVQVLRADGSTTVLTITPVRSFVGREGKKVAGVRR